MIYFITDGEYVKIGFTDQDDAENRLKALQVGNARKLTLIGTIPGGLTEEATLHKVFAQLRANGEWFAVTPPVTQEAPAPELVVITESQRRVYEAMTSGEFQTYSEIAEYLGVSRQYVGKVAAQLNGHLKEVTQ